MLTFETSSVQGVRDITEKLTVSHTRVISGGSVNSNANGNRVLQSLPFQKVVHQVSTLDAQPSNEAGGILVMVTGALLVDDQQNPMNYTQTFQLLPDGAGSYFVFNDIFRLVYGS
ncbi:unnamed protein product [Aspergillus oryzae var. brunneus]|uniref:Unnamed protein product n=1 Tax=Aspergillus oryzae var. brunneus TaxID=332754 RepID=A0ABQ6KVV6_ASPOZ|nr:unnamed protein product [Aspergillus oryzae var. brunneus]